MKTKHLVVLGVAAFVVYKLAKKAPAPVAPSTNGVGVIYAPGGTDVIMAEQFGGLGGFSIRRAFSSVTNSVKNTLKSAAAIPIVAIKKPLDLPKAVVEALPGGRIVKMAVTGLSAPLTIAALTTTTGISVAKALVTGKSVKAAALRPTAGVLSAVLPPPKAPGDGGPGALLDYYGNSISQARYDQLLADMNANGGQAYGLVDASGKQIQVTRAEYEAALAAQAPQQSGGSSSGSSDSGTSYTQIVDPNDPSAGGSGVTYSNQMPDGMQQQPDSSAADQQPQVPAETAAAPAGGGFSAGLALVGGGIAAAFMALSKK